MQFANDVTPLTLASTATLRDRIENAKINCVERQGMEREIESRSILRRVPAGPGEIYGDRPFREYR